MSRSFVGRWIIPTLGLVIGIFIFVIVPMLVGKPALAASRHGSGTGINPFQTPVVTETPTPGNGTGQIITADNLIPFLLILLFFGLLLIAGLLIYIYSAQSKYYAAAQRLSQIGVGVKAVQVPTITPAGVFQPLELVIDGPGLVTVGVSADFTVTKGDGTFATDAKWSATPPEAASVSPDKGATVSVFPKKKGPFVLLANIETNLKEHGSVSVAAVDPATSAELPFIGQGYGSLMIAILVVVALILLGVTKVLAADAVGTLLGGLLGYAFGVTTSAAAAKKSEGQTQGSGS